MTEAAFRNRIERGIAAHWSGQYLEAIALYREALALRPNDAEAMSLTGLALSQSNQAPEALALLARAVEIEPFQPGFRVNLAEGLLKAGRADDAFTVLQTVTEDFPDNVNAWEKIGDLLASRCDWDGAANAWSRAATLNPKVVTPSIKLGRLEISRARYAEARAALEEAAVRAPVDPSVLTLRGFVLSELREWPALTTLADDWRRRFPEISEGWRLAARAAFELGLHREACDLFESVLRLDAPSAANLAAYAGLCLHALDFEMAAKALDQAEALDPSNAQLKSTRALLHLYFGRWNEAETASRAALVAAPDHAAAYTILSRVRRGRLTPDEQEAAATLATREDLHLDRRIPAAFAVAHALDADGRTNEAFTAYERAHALALERDRLEGRRYDPAQVEDRARRLMAAAHEPVLARGESPEWPRPIFIFGMPRSGTTLIESVLAAHSEVLGCGERPLMPQILRASIAAEEAGRPADTATLKSWAAAYLADLPNLRGRSVITDKHPLNFEAVGLIARLFPGSSLVHVRRQPVETGLSIFRQEFSKHWSFAHRLADIGHYYGHYSRLMAHWNRVLPGRIVTIRYEDFVRDFDRAAPELVAACGLDWEPACRDFQQSPRAIATFSTVQARDPVRNANGRAERYREFLTPLVDALRAAGVDPETGALIEPLKA